jgi:hypothetical protein
MKKRTNNGCSATVYHPSFLMDLMDRSLREEIGPGREEANGRRLKRHAPRAGAWIAVPAQPRPADTWFFCETPQDTKPYQPECCKNPSTKESGGSAKEALWRHLEEAKYPLARTPLVSTLGQTWDCRIYVKKTPLTTPPGRPLRGSAMHNGWANALALS